MAVDKTLYIGTFVHCTSQKEVEVCEDGVIGVDETGKIAFVSREGQKSSTPEGWESAKVVRTAKNAFFFPGFIDTHIHASQYPNAGVFGNSTLLDWLNDYTFPLEGSFGDLEKANRVYNRVVARTLSHGTTTACYYATVHVPATNLLADICQTRGQRAFVGRVCMDRMSPDFLRDESPDTVIRDSKACIAHVKKIDPGYELITPILTPRFAPSCTDKTLELLGELFRETGIPCQTHIAENKPECALVKELFPKAKTYAHVYDDVGLLTEKTILAHAVHLDAEERSLVKKRDAKLSHCPASNTSLTSGRAKVREMLDQGITIGLGTDVSGGYTSSLLVEAREALFVSRHVAMEDGEQAKLTVEEVLYLATRGGAKVVGLADRVGGFEVGKEWDTQLVSLGSVGSEEHLNEQEGLVEMFGKETWGDRLAKWVYTGDDRNTTAVWVRGRLVHKRDVFKP